MQQTAGAVEVEEEKEEVKMEMKRKRRKEKRRDLGITEEEAGVEEEDSSEGTALDMSEGVALEDLETKRVLQLPPEKRKAVKWRVKMVEEEEDAVVAVEDSEGAVGSVAVEASAELDSVEDTGEEGADSEEIEVDSAAAAEQEEKGEAGEDSEEVGEDSVEATTEERAVLNSAITSPSASTKFSNLPKSSSFLRLHRLKFFFFIFNNSSLENSALWQDQSYKITRVLKS